MANFYPNLSEDERLRRLSEILAKGVVRRMEKEKREASEGGQDPAIK